MRLIVSLGQLDSGRREFLSSGAARPHDSPVAALTERARALSCPVAESPCGSPRRDQWECHTLLTRPAAAIFVVGHPEICRPARGTIFWEAEQDCRTLMGGCLRGVAGKSLGCSKVDAIRSTSWRGHGR